MSGEGDLKSKPEILSPGFSTCADFLLSQTYTNKIAAEVQEDPWAIKQPTRKFKKYFYCGITQGTIAYSTLSVNVATL